MMLVVVVVVFLTGGFYVSGLLFHATGTPPWLFRSVKASTSSELYPGYFRLLCFCQAFPSQFYRERFWADIFYPQALFYLAVLPYIFGTFCDSDSGRNTPSRILLCACPHRVVPSGWRMDLEFVPLCRQLILYRFLGCLRIHSHQLACISFHYFTGQMKKVIYVFHGNGNSWNLIFITII